MRRGLPAWNKRDMNTPLYNEYRAVIIRIPGGSGHQRQGKGESKELHRDDRSRWMTSRKIDAVMADAHSGRLCCRPLAAGEVELCTGKG